MLLLPPFSGVYDNPATMARECWYMGRLQWCFSASLLFLKNPHKHVNSEPPWATGKVLQRYDAGSRKWVTA